MSAGKVDVLALLDGLGDYAEMSNEDSTNAERIREARAAVAELIEEREGLVSEARLAHSQFAKQLIRADRAEACVPQAALDALVRCHECFDDDEGTDVPRLMLDALVAIGWLSKPKRGYFQITDAGCKAVDAALARIGGAP